MENNLLKLIPPSAIFVMLLIASCNDAAQKKEIPEKPEKDKLIAAPSKEENKRPPIINIMDTLSDKHLVLYMKDSAATAVRITMKLGEILGFKLAAVIKKNKLKITGQPVAWYNGRKAPCFFEAGMPVDKKPAKIPANVFIKQIGIDSVVVAHFHGPYELLPQAYEALDDYMKGRKRKLKAKPYEIYVDDPMDKDGKMKDPYKVQTDVVYPWK